MCDAHRCHAAFKDDLETAFNAEIDKAGLSPERVSVLRVGGLGFCSAAREDISVCVLVRPDNAVYFIRGQEDVARIVREHLGEGRIVDELRCQGEPISRRFFDLYGDVAFFSRQSRIALRNAGVVNPESIDEYMRYNGFRALSHALAKGDPEWVIAQVTASKLRGRGGGGFPTGLKWKSARASAETTRYIICNADEGDPGAFMDRSMLESDPFSVVEGMILGGFAIGAQRGFFYVRAEYPLAIRRIEHALSAGREHPGQRLQHGT